MGLPRLVQNEPGVVLPFKAKCRERSDGIVALTMALERATTHDAMTRPYFYWWPEDGVVL